MKLYTKEMFIQAAEKCEVSMIDANHIINYIDEYVTPIELPTDEEIEKFAVLDFPFEDNIHSNLKNMLITDEMFGFEQGAKWMRDKIQGGNK